MAPFVSIAKASHRRVAFLCFLVLCLEGYDVTALGYATPALIEVWHVRAPQFTTAITAGSIGMLLGSVFAGQLGDRFGRKPVLLACVAVFGVFSLATARCTDLGSLTVLRTLTCLGLGGGVPLAIALTTNYAPPVYARRLVIMTSGGLAVGSTVGGFAAREFVTSFGWEAIFVVGGLLPIFLIPLLAGFLPESRALRRESAGDVRANLFALFRNGLALRTIALWVADFCNVLCAFLILLWLPALLHSMGYSPASAIFVTTMYTFGSIPGFILAATIADTLGVERVTASILLLGAICVLLAGSLQLPYLALCIVTAGIGIGIGGGQHGINAVSGALYPATIRATGAGWALGIARVGQVAGPLGAGLLLNIGWQPRDILLAASVPAFCVVVGMAFLANLRHRHELLAQ
jgi:AAHS family 4-hydroxybenzoate transporter-like MFS transporter